MMMMVVEIEIGSLRIEVASRHPIQMNVGKLYVAGLHAVGCIVSGLFS